MLALRRALRSALLRFFEPEVRAWYGLMPLWKVFWGYGVLTSFVMIATYLYALKERQVAVQQVLLVVFAAYTAWILVAVWRCAETSDPHWRLIARCLTFAWASNAALVVLFLQLDLVAAYIKS